MYMKLLQVVDQKFKLKVVKEKKVAIMNYEWVNCYIRKWGL